MSRTQRELKAMRQQQREDAAARQRARDRRNLFIIGGILGTAAIVILVWWLGRIAKKALRDEMGTGSTAA